MQNSQAVSKKATHIMKKVKVKATQSCLTLCDPLGCSVPSRPSVPVPHRLPEFAQAVFMELVMLSNHLTEYYSSMKKMKY